MSSCICERRDCPDCEAERQGLIQLLLNAVDSGEVTEDQVYSAVFQVKEAESN